MWPNPFRPAAGLDEHDRFVIAPHHVDRLRRPSFSASTADDEFRHALVWNIFRTLELVTPSFWLRRLHLRLTGDASLRPPQVASVHLWRPLPLPPVQCLDGDRPTVAADVLIETEHSVWTLVVESPRRSLTDGRQAAAIVDAGAWFAGARHHYCGVIESGADTSSAALLKSRYSRSRESSRLQSSTRGPSTPTQTRWGGVLWSELSALLQDCADASILPPIERALAHNAFAWLTRVGIDPPPPAALTISG